MLAGVVAMVVAGCATDPGVVTESARRPDATTTPTAPPDRSAGDRPAAPSTAPATDPPTTAPAPTDPPAAIGDTLDLGDDKQPRVYDDLVRAAIDDIQRWWSEQYPALYGEPLRADQRRRLRRLPRAHDADPRVRDVPADAVRGHHAVLGLLLRPGRLHGLRRRRAGRPVPARQRARTVDPHRRAGPRVRARHPGPRRRARPRPADDRHRAAGGLLRRGVGGAGGARRGRRRRVHRRRRAHRACPG